MENISKASMMKYRLSIVSYINTFPFLYGIQRHWEELDIEYSLDYPSECAQKLINGQVDIGLVPVGILPKMNHYQIISDYCIGSDGKVDSVLLLSQVPLNEIECIILDYQSVTSVLLTKILAKYFWHLNVKWRKGRPGYEHQIVGKEAVLVIGDRAFTYKTQAKFVYDLSVEWKKFTSLPFVFALWVANKPIDQNFIDKFNTVLSIGINNLDKVIAEYQNLITNSNFDMYDYLANKISYQYDNNKRMAMNKFLQLARSV